MEEEEGERRGCVVDGRGGGKERVCCQWKVRRERDVWGEQWMKKEMECE